jgi:hypothetical protein
VCLLEQTRALTHLVAAPRFGSFHWTSGEKWPTRDWGGQPPGAGYVADRGPGLCQPPIWIGSDTGSASNHFVIDSRLPARPARPYVLCGLSHLCPWLVTGS